MTFAIPQFIDRHALAESHIAPLRASYKGESHNPAVRVTIYREGRVEKVIEGDPGRVKRELASYYRSHKQRGKR